MQILKMSVYDAEQSLKHYFSASTNHDYLVMIEREIIPGQKAKHTSEIMSDEQWTDFIKYMPPRLKIPLIKLLRSAVEISLSDAKNFVEERGCK